VDSIELNNFDYRLRISKPNGIQSFLILVEN